MEHKFIELKKFRKEDYGSFVLGGDVSATNTSLSIAGIKGDDIEPLFILRFRSKEMNGISEALNDTLKFAAEKHGINVSHACLSPAGPISPARDHCKLTNVPWEIDVKKVLGETMLDSIALVNDFEAIGFGVPFLDEKNKDDLVELAHPGKKMPKPVPKAVKGIVGAGTGLGKALLFYHEEKKAYAPSPSEGGHADLPVADSYEYELMQSVKDRRGGEAPCDWEDILSGRGIVAIYDFLLEMEEFNRNDVSAEIDSADDKAACISKHAKKDPACNKAFDIFIRFYARALRNTALDIMARGGMYIAGGIAAKNMEFFTDGALMKEFETNHTMHNVLKDIPVFVITNYNVSLFGTANVAANFPELAIKK
ncbi:glucokinase [Candidatus Woesearchaeota archaeon]|nr:glucokinase [Candidatus Woesearchaeota archaeon]